MSTESRRRHAHPRDAARRSRRRRARRRRSRAAGRSGSGTDVPSGRHTSAAPPRPPAPAAARACASAGGARSRQASSGRAGIAAPDQRGTREQPKPFIDLPPRFRGIADRLHVLGDEEIRRHEPRADHPAAVHREDDHRDERPERQTTRRRATRHATAAAAQQHDHSERDGGGGDGPRFVARQARGGERDARGASAFARYPLARSSIPVPGGGRVIEPVQPSAQRPAATGRRAAARSSACSGGRARSD